MELKLTIALGVRAGQGCSNRTFMELKFAKLQQAGITIEF